MSMALDRFCLMVSLAKPSAVDLSTCMGVDGFLTVGVGGSNFRFGSGSHDVADDF